MRGRQVFRGFAVLAFAVLTMGQDSCSTGGGGGNDRNDRQAKQGALGVGATGDQSGGGSGGAFEETFGGDGGGGGGGGGAITDPCDPNYSGCLDPNSSDYDCEGGTGDGPDYTGRVEVRGTDVHDLDRDGDGIACDI